MLEIMNKPHCYMYSKREIREINQQSNQIPQYEWVLFRKLDRFPFDLESDSYFLRTLTETFKNQLELDLKEKVFKVTYVPHQITRCKIPKYLMDIDESNPVDIMKRFVWVDDDTIKLVSKEGVEVLIDLNKLVQKEKQERKK